jgi:NAD(P)-dependent dehydrogenase (short-subunit alcohol dehydrogenase family)
LLSPSERCEIVAREVGAIAARGSVCQDQDLANLVSMTLKTYGHVDAVINNTGFEDYSVVEASKSVGFDWELDGHLLDIPDEGWHQQYDLLFLSVVKMTRHVTKPMIEHGGGVILNISAPIALEPSQDYPMSSIMRAMLASFTKLYSDAYARYNLRMNSILVGYVSNLDFPEATKHAIPAGRYASPEEIARACAAFLSEDAAYVTGENIAVDGGVKRSL